MPDITFPTTSAPGRRPQESGGRLINAYADKAPVGAPSKVIVRRSPGLQRVAINNSHIHTRGFLDSGTVAFWILDDRALSVGSTYAVTDLGALTGDQPVTLARNNNSPNDYVVVTENGTFNLFTGSAPTAFASPNLPGSPTSVCDFDGYFVWSFGDGTIFASDLNSVTVAADSFTTEQGLFVRRVARFAGSLFAFGDKWTGVYSDVGSVPFPFQRQVTIPRGIVGSHAIAGWEAGWSNELIWVGDDFVVYKLDGYTPTPISTDDVSRDIQIAVLAGDRNLIEAFVYMYERAAFWTLTCHERWTWEFNLATGEWNERRSYLRDNWKGMKSIRIFDQWLVGDEYSGELYAISGSYFLEGTDPLIWQVESGVMSAFPRGVVIPRASFNITSAVGNFMAGAADPLVEISWSLDGGHSFGDPVLRRLGGPGESHSHPYVLNSGLSKGQGVRYRLRVSDPVHVGLSGGTVEVGEPRSFSG